MKITVSGWAGAGSTALSIILAHELGFKLVQGSGVFRYIFKELSYLTSGEQRNEAHNYVEPYFGPIYDDYIDLILSDITRNQTIIDSDIASFRIGKKPDIASIFLFADIEVRKTRTQGDNRAEDGKVLEKIDEENRQMYIKLHQSDVMDLNEINLKHQLVIDNSLLSIAEELELVSKFLSQFDPVNMLAYNSVAQRSLDIEKQFWNLGKDKLISDLRSRNLIPGPQEILLEISSIFKDRILKLPDNLKKIILK